MPKETHFVDITPDKSIFHKIGEANYSISDAVAELVDNSIDAAKEEGVEIVIVLDKRNGKIVISDNGKGMDKEKAAKSLVLAHSVKKNSLGEFGLGLKSACMSLGKSFTIKTTVENSNESYVLSYDKEKFMEEGSWNSFPINIEKEGREEHGTVIEITSLKIKLYDALVTRLKEELAQRYGPFITHNNVIIRVGAKESTAKPCSPKGVELDHSGKNEFEYVLSNGEKVWGWWGLRKSASGVESGFDMFRRSRLIKAAEKLGYNLHPMTAHITGEIHLDSIPVTHNKREFITESGEFREFIENFWGDKTAKLTGERTKGLIDEIITKATERWNAEKVDKQIPDTIKDTIKNNVLRALNRVEDFKELAFPNWDGVQKKRSERGEEAPLEERETLKIASEEPVKNHEHENEKRTPIKTQNKTAKFIIVNGRKLQFDFTLRNLNNEHTDKEVAITDKGIEIYINTGFKGFALSKDSNYYCIAQVAEAMAETYLKETGQGLEKIISLRNKLIYEVASVVMEEEDLKKLTKQEEELERIRKEKEELIEKHALSNL
jgi:hypothetical protein